jgi:threonine dehydratase
MPENSPDIKIKGVRELGADIVFCEPTQQAREATLARIVAQTGAFFVPPYNHEWVIAGQATAALEAFKQVPSAELIIAPLGGGGLLSGTALAAKYSGYSIDVFGAEPSEMDDGKRSFDTGVIQANKPGAQTIADGLRTQVGSLPFNIIKSHVKDIFTVTEEEIIHAMRLIWERLKVVAEPSAAVPLAAAIRNQKEIENKNVIIILSGGNTDLDKLPF